MVESRWLGKIDHFMRKVYKEQVDEIWVLPPPSTTLGTESLTHGPLGNTY
jgi:hypothetical protein